MVKAKPLRVGRAKSDHDRRADRPAMGDRDNILARVCRFARATPRLTRSMTSTKLSPFGALVRGRVPGRNPALLPAEQKRLAVESLPIAEMLFGKVLVLANFGNVKFPAAWMPSPFAPCVTMARHPDRVLRQQRSESWRTPARRCSRRANRRWP